LPGARHKDAAAIESKAPTAMATAPAGQEPKRTIIKSAAPGVQNPMRGQMPRETLIIASRLKEYIQARSEMNTSAGVIDVLSDFVRIVCDRATENARADGRKTVLDRDFEFLKKSNY
jgi:histone H3/H4